MSNDTCNVQRLRIVATLMGDFRWNPIVRTKHFHFFEALANRYDLVDVFDAGLRGVGRWFNALSVADLNRSRWRERFYKNPAAFRMRSHRASTFLNSIISKADVSLQFGALFDAAEGCRLPTVIYSDYTSVLSARRPEAGRSPFRPMERLEWISMETAALYHAAHICTRSRLVKDSLIKDYNIPADRITVVGGGLNYAALPELPLRSERRSPTILFIGKDFFRKGGDLLLEAFHLVRKKRFSAKLVMVTDGPIPSRLPLENVEVIYEACNRDRISQLYQLADIFVLPARLETWGDVLLEAMAFGLPCIATKTDAMGEIVDADRTGFLVPFGKVSTLAEHILTLIDNVNLRRSMGDAARRKVESQFLWKHVVDRFAPVLEHVRTAGFSRH